MKKYAWLLLLGWLITALPSCEISGEGVVTPDDEKTENPDDGKEDTEDAIFEIDSEGNYLVEASGGTIEVEVTTNLDYTVEIPVAAQEWLRVADTRATRTERLTFMLTENSSKEERAAEVRLLDDEQKELQKIGFRQSGAENEENPDDGKEDTPENPSEVPNNQIWYTSTDGNKVVPNNLGVFGAYVLTNEYKDGKGILHFSDDIYEIGEEAFANRGTLKSLQMPDCVTAIGIDAFSVCENLEEITFGNGVKTIKEGAFLKAGLKSLVIPDCVTEIEDYAFANCKNLTEVTLGDGLTIIGDGAFSNTNNLTTVYFGSKLVEIGEWVFAYSVLSALNLPASLEAIGAYAFEGCEQLTEVVIPEGVTTIGEAVFEGCSSLKNLSIPGSVTCWGWTYEDGYISDDHYMGLLGNICPPVETIVLGEGLQEIPENFCRGAKKLKNINFPEGLTTIGESAFSGCEQLSEVVFPEGLTTMGAYIFEGCYALKSLTIPGSVTNWVREDSYFYDDRNFLFNGIRPDFEDFPYSLERLVLGEGLKEIPENFCTYMYTLKHIDFPQGLTKIADGAFAGCLFLEEIILPEGLTTIGDQTFGGTAGTEYLYQMGSIETPKQRVISLPSTLETIGEYSLTMVCSAPSDIIVYCKSLVPPVSANPLTPFGCYFVSQSDTASSTWATYVPYQSYEAYADPQNTFYHGPVTPYDFEKNQVVEMAKEVKCGLYHHATGEWPDENGNHYTMNDTFSIEKREDGTYAVSSLLYLDEVTWIAEYNTESSKLALSGKCIVNYKDGTSREFENGFFSTAVCAYYSNPEVNPATIAFWCSWPDDEKWMRSEYDYADSPCIISIDPISGKPTQFDTCLTIDLWNYDWEQGIFSITAQFLCAVRTGQPIFEGENHETVPIEATRSIMSLNKRMADFPVGGLTCLPKVFSQSLFSAPLTR